MSCRNTAPCRLRRATGTFEGPNPQRPSTKKLLEYLDGLHNSVAGLDKHAQPTDSTESHVLRLTKWPLESDEAQ